MEENETSAAAESGSEESGSSLKENGLIKAFRQAGEEPRFRKCLPVALPPLIVIVIMLVMAKMHGLYPFGSGAMSWCDMSQQVVPLLSQFKEMLESGSAPSVFYSFRAGGGMSMYGVYFFNLASPFTYLVKFVPKEDMLMFANVLIVLKMACCALTASICFSVCRKKLGAGETVLLSVMYPFCGYTMLYYQNIPWLDMMYLFPLLIIALKKLFSEHKPLMYIIVLSYSMFADFYICAMLIIFVLLYAGVFMLMNSKGITADKKRRERLFRTGRELFIGSFISALITSFVWLPCFMQYRSSVRTSKKLMEVLAESDTVPPFTTMLPVLLFTGFAAAVILIDLFCGRKRSRGNDQMLLLLGLMLIPFAIEPINKVWHLGSYICFPGRFGYMTIFLALYCCSYALEKVPERVSGLPKLFVCGLLTVTMVYFYRSLIDFTLEEKLKQVGKYVNSLWGDETSLKLTLGLFFMAVICYGIIYAAYHNGIFIRKVFLGLSGLVFLIESTAAVNIYMVYPADTNAEQNIKRGNIYSLSGKIDDDGFYRVKSYSKLFDNNIIGAMGYDTISHYTSLTGMDYATAMKHMGYSTTGLEVSSVGGTRLTDALLSIRYEINGGISHSDEIYKDENGFIHRLPDYLPMGIMLPKGVLDDAAELPTYFDRTDVQRFISERVLGENVVEKYLPAEEVQVNDGIMTIPEGTVLHYTIDASREKTIYLDCYNGMSTRYKESFYDAIEVKVNGSKRGSKYPYATNSGVIRLGDVSGGDIEVELTFVKSVSVYSLGVFGIDVERIEELLEKVKGVGLTEDGEGILSGSCHADAPCTCFLSLPYYDGYTITVNGVKTEYRKAFTGFTAIDLEAGDNSITVSFTPPGFKAGAAITAAGVLLLALYLFFRRKLKGTNKLDAAAWVIMSCTSAAVFMLVYIMPLYVNIFR